VEEVTSITSYRGAESSVPAAPEVQRRPGRFVRSLSDERLVSRVRAGDEAAFEAIYDRHHRGLLSFCRHMLGSQQEAEDAVQHTFIAAYRSLISGDRDIQLKAWLYAIARNKSLSVLRARREHVPLDDVQPATEGLAAEVERRQDLKDLLGDLQRLPDEQRAALVLSEIGAHTHDEIGLALDVPTNKVKALVFQARTSIAGSRNARETPCEVVQEQLATLHGGELRRTQVRRHVEGCPACQAFKAETQRQRAAMAIVLPVIPAATLKSGVLGATIASAGSGVGVGGSGTAAAGGVSTALGGGSAIGGAVVASGLVVAASKGLLMKGLLTAAVASAAMGGYVALDSIAGLTGHPADPGFDVASAIEPAAAARFVAGGVGLSVPADGSAEALVLRPTPYAETRVTDIAQLPPLKGAPAEARVPAAFAGGPAAESPPVTPSPVDSRPLAGVPSVPSLAVLDARLPHGAQIPSARRILSGAPAPPVVRVPPAADVPAISVPRAPLPPAVPAVPAVPVAPAPVAPVTATPPAAPAAPTLPPVPVLSDPPIAPTPALAPPAVPTGTPLP
jgi:RNA polymerase sigma factor (sigma-70 family)